LRQLIVGAIVGGVLGVMAFTACSSVMDPGAKGLAFGAFAAETQNKKDYEASKKEPVYPGVDTPEQMRDLAALCLSAEIVFATHLLIAKNLLEHGLIGAVIGGTLGVAVLVTLENKKSAQAQTK